MSVINPRPEWFDAQIELARLNKAMAELEAGRGRGKSTLPLRLVRDRIDRHIAQWAIVWAREAAALIAQCEDVSMHLCLAVARLQETKDDISLGHVREALDTLGEREKFMTTIAALYEALERDYIIHRRKSLRNIKCVWRTHLKAAFGDLPAHGLSADAVTEYVANRQKEGAANATINRETGCLRRMFTLAVRAEKLTRQPFMQQLPEINTRSGFLKDSQYDALARETWKAGLWLRAMLECGFVYGWRKTELLRLKVRQVDFQERTIVLDAGTTKNNDSRQVELTDCVFELLQRCVAGKQPEDYVFTRDRESNGRRTKTADGHIVDFRRSWARACSAAGCPGLRFHDLRRSAARNLIRAGVQQKTSMAITGHRTASMFQRYNIVDQADLTDAMRKLEAYGARRREQAVLEGNV